MSLIYNQKNPFSPRGEPPPRYRPANDNPRLPARKPPVRLPDPANDNVAARAVSRAAAMALARRLGLRFIPVVGNVITLLDLWRFLSRQLAGPVGYYGKEYPGYALDKDCRGPGPFVSSTNGLCSQRTLTKTPGDFQTVRQQVADQLLAKFSERVPVPGTGSYAGYYWMETARVFVFDGVQHGALMDGWASPEGWSARHRSMRGRSGSLADLLPSGIPAPAGDAPPVPAAPDVPSRWTREITFGPDGAEVSKPSQRPSRSRPPSSVREQKKRGSAALGIALFRALDVVSEASEKVQAVYEALPEATRKPYDRAHRSGRGLLDQAGQYGINGADWRIPVIIEHWAEVDWGKAIQGVVFNEIEDKIVGGAMVRANKVYRGPKKAITPAL